MEVHVDVAYIAEFSHNGEKLENSDYVSISNIEHDVGNRMKGRMNLTIFESNKSRDEGDYKCTVKDLHGNTNSILATVIFVDDPIVNLVPKNSLIEVQKGKKQSQFLIEYTAYPTASFYLYDTKNTMISSNTDVMNREKYDVIIDKDQLKFKIKYPNINDYGNYTLVASTVGVNFTTSLKLVVSGKFF